MIYITGDCHQDFKRFRPDIFPEQEKMTKDDYVIICGDFGGVWDTCATVEEIELLDSLERLPFTTLFVDGNHENFDRLYGLIEPDEFPEEEWHGGKVHKIRPSVIHLMRGQIYDIEGLKFFTFGGARCHDISGGILDPDAPDFQEQFRKAQYGYKPFRVNHISWWEQELPSKGECEEGLKNLEAAGNEVDFIITHCAPTDILARIFTEMYDGTDRLTDYLEEIEKRTKFKKWFFGHYHNNCNIGDKFIMIYEQIIRIA